MKLGTIRIGVIMAMDERIERQEIDHQRRLVTLTEVEHPIELEHPIEWVHPIEQAHRIERVRPIERALQTEVRCRTDNLPQHQTGHQASILRRRGPAHHMEEAGVLWVEEVVHLEEEEGEGDNGMIRAN